MKRVLVLSGGCEAFSWQEDAPDAGSLRVGFCRGRRGIRNGFVTPVLLRELRKLQKNKKRGSRQLGRSQERESSCTVKLSPEAKQPLHLVNRVKSPGERLWIGTVP